MNKISLENVSFRYSQTKNDVIKNLSMDIYSKDITIIQGANGSGKTTLSKLCCNIYKPNNGIVTIFSKDAKNLSLSDVAKDIYYLFQDPQKQLFCESVEDEIAFALKYQNYTLAQIEQTTNKMLELFNLNDIKKSYPLLLSGGEKQRLAIACGVAIKPKLMIMDEPTSSLDTENMINLVNIILKLKHDYNMGFLIISHDLDFINRIGDVKYMMQNGGVINET